MIEAWFGNLDHMTASVSVWSGHRNGDPNALALVQELRDVATLLADRETDPEAVAQMLPVENC